jgi:hypothetical protein
MAGTESGYTRMVVASNSPSRVAQVSGTEVDSEIASRETAPFSGNDKADE